MPISEVATGAEFDCHAQVRAHGDPVPAIARVESVADESGVERAQIVVTLTDPLRGVAPGQTVVLYQAAASWGRQPLTRPAHSSGKSSRSRHLPGETYWKVNFVSRITK